MVKGSTKRQAAKEGSLESITATPEELTKFYREMLLIRRFEEKAGQLSGMGLIFGFCHLYIGQEAVVVGMQAAITPDDGVITSYRDHGHMLVCGMDPRGVMAELTGRTADSIYHSLHRVRQSLLKCIQRTLGKEDQP